MKVIVIGDGRSADQMNSRMGGSKLDWIWLNQVSDLSRQHAADIYIDLGFVMDPGRIDHLSQFLPRPVLVNSVIHTLSEIERPFIRINAWPGFLKRNVAEISLTGTEQEKQIQPFFDLLDWPYLVAPDIPGMISARVVSMIVNEAYFTFQDKTSSKAEIDIAMKLGTNYPQGPFEWSREIGLKNIYELLLLLNRHNPRYELSKSLQLEVLENKN